MANTAILFVHGFIGSCRQFTALAELLSDCNADMFFHVLPGHEATIEDFKKTNADIWQSSVDERLKKLSESYDRILVVGHSMGGLLAVRAAIAAPEKVCGIAAIGFPIKVSVGYDWLKLNMDASRPAHYGEDPRVTAARSMAGVAILNVGQYLSTLPQNMEFLKTTRLARRDLHKLTAPLKVINFERDEIVASSVPDFVRAKKPDAKIVMLPESYHFYFTANELVRMADEIRNML